MAVASPYAVFRAVDLGWPLAVSLDRAVSVDQAVSTDQAEPMELEQAHPALQATAVRNPPTKRRYGGTLRRRTAPQWNTLIQGELFPA